jgi:hypothetical protein
MPSDLAVGSTPEIEEERRLLTSRCRAPRIICTGLCRIAFLPISGLPRTFAAQNTLRSAACVQLGHMSSMEDVADVVSPPLLMYLFVRTCIFL